MRQRRNPGAEDEAIATVAELDAAIERLIASKKEKRRYDPEALEGLAKTSYLQGSLTSRGYLLLAQRMRDEEIPRYLPNGCAARLGRLLVFRENLMGCDSND
jgi:hypothetical protein